MKLVIRERAADDLEGIFAWIAKQDPQAAVSVIRRIRQRLDRLASGLAHRGRPGRRAGTRELIEGPYVIVYQVNEERDEVVVLAVFHGAQER